MGMLYKGLRWYPLVMLPAKVTTGSGAGASPPR